MKKITLILTYIFALFSGVRGQGFAINDTLINKQVDFIKLPFKDTSVIFTYYNTDSLYYKRTHFVEKTYQIIMEDFSLGFEDSLRFNNISILGQKFTFGQLAKNGRTPWKFDHLFLFSIRRIYYLQHQQSQKEYLILYSMFGGTSTMGLESVYTIVFEIDKNKQVKNGFLYRTSSLVDKPFLECVANENNDNTIDFLRWNDPKPSIYYYNLIDGKVTMKKSRYQVIRHWDKALRYYKYKLVGK